MPKGNTGHKNNKKYIKRIYKSYKNRCQKASNRVID